MAKNEKNPKPERYFHLHDSSKTSDYFRGLQYIDPSLLKTIINSTPNNEEAEKKFDSSFFPPKNEDEPVEVENVSDKLKTLEVGTTMSCNYCKVEFENSEQQRIHFKLDWHRYNLKQNLLGKLPLTEEQFDTMVASMEEENDNISISGSDFESDEDKDVDTEEEEDMKDDSTDLFLQRHPKLFFRCESGKILSMYKSILVSPKERELPSPEEITSLALSSVKRQTWAVLLLGGGHFAGAIFRGGEVLVHKTFHCYTVRAKQGGGQSSADGRSGTNSAKSAGASLRRYNEMALIQHIQEIVKVWEDQFKQCQLIFYRAASSNRSVLFGGKTPPLDKNDERLRTIPFPTKRATFSELKRVQERLAAVDVFADWTELEKIVRGNVGSREGGRGKGSPSKGRIHRSKSRDLPVRPLPGIVQNLVNKDSDSENGEITELEMAKVLVTTDHLKQFENTGIRKKGKRKKNSKIESDVNDCALESSEDEEKSIANKKSQELTKLKNDLLTAVRTGNNKELESCITVCKMLQEEKDSEENCLEDTKENFEEKDSISKKNCEERESKENHLSVEELVNLQFGETKTSCLHIAAKHSHRNVLLTLLLNGADPAVRDRSKKVPFNYTVDKETRNEFRKFQGKYPDKYDYKSAQIPPPLSVEAEEEKSNKMKEKKKAQRLVKKEKEKGKKEEEGRIKKDEEEKQRFLNLSDREKRALAAERRILAAHHSEKESSPAPVLQRCYNCAVDTTGKVPFEFSDYQFCSIKCVKLYRTKLDKK